METRFDIPNLETIEFGEVEEIEEGAFYGCKRLTNVIFSGSDITMKDDVFKGCSKLESINISKNIASLGEGVFYGCELL